jgi:hypothetical protein
MQTLTTVQYRCLQRSDGAQQRTPRRNSSEQRSQIINTLAADAATVGRDKDKTALDIATTEATAKGGCA